MIGDHEETKSPMRAGGSDRISTKAKLADEMLSLGRVLVRVRERQGLKQAEVAARLGLPASYMSKVEKGTRRLDAIELIQVCNAMGVDPADIIRELQREIRMDREVVKNEAGRA
jgi:transcriptional regulator with XRE-family HTH domain